MTASRAALASLVVVLAACSGPPASTHTDSGPGVDAGSVDPCEGAPAATLSGDVQPIFTASCATTACHSGTRPAGGLSLEAGTTHHALVGVASTCPDGRTLVTAGDPAASYLVNKITNVGICGGSRMPLTGPTLTDAQIAAIRGWICNGALDD